MKDQKMMTDEAVTFKRLSPEGHYLFGYYDICPWSADGQSLFAMRVERMDCEPGPRDVAELGLIDVASRTFEPFGQTTCWNFQQGCFMHWLPGTPNDKVIYNTRRDGQCISVIHDVRSGKHRWMPAPIAAVSPTGHHALTLNFARMATHRPGYGYAGLTDPVADEPCPHADGVGLLDLETGEHRLVLSLADGFAAIGEPREAHGHALYYNHVGFNTTGDRFLALLRWHEPGQPTQTELITADLAGRDVRHLAPRVVVSHYHWRDARTILVWADVPPHGQRFWLVPDGEGACEPAAEHAMTRDGHCTYSHDRRWILNDTYPDAEHHRTLYLWDVEHGRRIDLARLYSDPAITGPIRCDLHPAWSRDDRQIAFHSIHEGERAIYMLNASMFTEGS